LVCTFGKCHAACHQTLDCPQGDRCIKLASGNVCQQPDEVQCTFTSMCPDPLKCAVDSKCRVACIDARDCLEQQKCVSHVCADSDEIDVTTGDIPHSNSQGYMGMGDGGVSTGDASSDGGAAMPDGQLQSDATQADDALMTDAKVSEAAAPDANVDGQMEGSKPPGDATLYVVGTSNVVAAYRIDINSGTPTRLDSDPLTAGVQDAPTGTNPVQAVLSPSGQFLYVSNSGTQDVSAFAVDAATGVLTPIEAIPDAGAPIDRFAVTPQQPKAMVIDSSGKFLIVASGVGFPNASTQRFSIGSDGRLSSLGPFSIGDQWARLTVDAFGTVLASQPNGAFRCYRVDGAGTITEVGNGNGTVVNVTSIIGSLTKRIAYVVADHRVFGVGYDANCAFTAAFGTKTLGTVNLDEAVLALHPSGSYLYVASPVTSTLYIHHLAADGTIEDPTTVAISVAPTSIALDRSGRYLYASSVAADGGSGGEVDVYAVSGNGATVNPTPLGTAAGPAPTWSIAVLSR
jgi:DNA-binding beta-propeller fold protein YncE